MKQSRMSCQSQSRVGPGTESITKPMRALAALVALVACGHDAEVIEGRQPIERAGGLTQEVMPGTITVTVDATFVGKSRVVTPDSPAVFNANLGTRFASIDQVGYHFWFVNDPLDPGEALGIGYNGAGAKNVTSGPQWQRRLDFDMGNAGIVEPWLDGKEKKFAITAWDGAFQIERLQIVVIGVPLRPSCPCWSDAELASVGVTYASSRLIYWSNVGDGELAERLVSGNFETAHAVAGFLSNTEGTLWAEPWCYYSNETVDWTGWPAVEPTRAGTSRSLTITADQAQQCRDTIEARVAELRSSGVSLPCYGDFCQ